MFCANNNYSTHFVGNEISAEEWRILAEVVSVLHGIHVLVFQSQTDTCCAISTAWIECMVARHKLINQVSYVVADIEKSWTPFDSLESLPTKTVDTNSLSATTKKLIDRMKLEFTRYVPSPDNDMLMAMLLNPPIAQFGFEWLLQADSNFSKQSIEDVKTYW